MFDTLEQMVVETAATVRPPERLHVSEAAEKYRYLNNPGSFIGPWDNRKAPYLVEPMDVLTSVSHTAMIFAGPAQCGKTDMFLNWQTYTVLCDPADMMLIEKSQTTARDFSKRRIDRLHRHTKLVGERLVQRRNYDNTFDKQYSSGMLVTLSWPAINELSGKPIPRLWLSDYDRMPQDVDQEGSPFDLARKRGTTFGRFMMCAAESSPGFVISDSKWMAHSKHEAPPTDGMGILALYNRGDRRRWYWRCFSCQNAYEPDFHLLTYPDSEDPEEAGEQATMVCPHCDAFMYHAPRDGLPGKDDMNQLFSDGGHAAWLKDGEFWNQSGEIVGKAQRSEIASFWLKGVAAAFADWKTLVARYITAKREFDRTGSEEALKTTVTTDQGLAYLPKSLEGERRPEELKARAQDYGERIVPYGVRFLVATVDVQKNKFVVQVHGYGVGGDVWIVDRYDIRKSERLDDDGERFWVTPGAYPEDWHLLVKQVMLKSYPLADETGRHMPIRLTLCDSGGREGVTANAYAFHRWLRTEENDHPEVASKFMLLKGASAKEHPRVKVDYPDSDRKDRFAGARGEIPVLFINPNTMKDQVNQKLDRTDPNGGRVNFPKWLPDTFYTELTVEVKTHKGWENPKNYRNESWDLLVYAEAAVVSKLIGIERWDWENPPGWAEEWDINTLIFNPTVQPKAFAPVSKSVNDLASLAEILA